MSVIKLDLPEGDINFDREVSIGRRTNSNGEEEFVTLCAKTGRRLPIPVSSYDKSEEAVMDAILASLEKAKLPFEVAGANMDLMTLIENTVLSENPIIALPKQWPQAHQVICLNLPGEMYSGADKDVLNVGDVMKASHEANATMALLMFLAEIVHKSVVGMEDAKPPKRKKKGGKKKKGGAKNEEEEGGEAMDVDDEYEEIPFVPIDSFVRDLNTKGFLRNSFKHYQEGQMAIDVPRIVPMMERLINKNLVTIGYRFFIFVLDPSYDINNTAEEMMRRVHSMQTDYDERKSSGAKQDPFVNPIGHTCYRRVGSLGALSKLLQLYYGNSHPVTKLLQESATELGGTDIPLSSQYCKAHLSTVLSLENALSHPMVSAACAAQKEPLRYKVGGIPRRFPLPMTMHSMEYSAMDPQLFYKARFPVSIHHRLFKERIMEGRKAGSILPFSEPDCSITDYSQVQAAVGSKSRSEVDSMLSAGRAKANPGMRSIKDNLRNLDILAAKGPAFDDLRRDIETLHTVKSPGYRTRMSEFKTEQIQNGFDLLNKYEGMIELFSPAYIASLAHLGETSASDHWADWFMSCNNLDPHAQALNMLMHRMTRVHNIKRGQVQRNCLRHYFAMLTSAHPHDNMKCNLLTIDSQATSKSFALQVIEKLALDNTCQNFSHVTANAFNVSGSRNGVTLIMEEMNPAMIGMGPNGKANPTELSSNMKNMITNQRTTVLACFVDEFGGRKAVTSTQPVRGAILAAMNHKQSPSSTGKANDVVADLSRFLVAEPDPVFKTEGEATLQDLVCGEIGNENEDYNNNFTLEMKTFHAIYIHINMMIGFNILHKVNHDLVTVVCSELNRRLSQNGMEKMITRRIEQVKELAIAICTWCAIVICTGMEHSIMFRKDESDTPQRYGPKVIREIEKLLVVNSQHVMFALTLINSHIVPLARQQVQNVLWNHRDQFKAHECRYKEGNVEVLDPRYDLLEIGTMDHLASFIAEHSQSDVSAQVVRAQLDLMTKITKQGEGPVRVVLRNADGYCLSAQERATALAGNPKNKEKWHAKLLMIPPEKTVGISNRFSCLLVLKRGYDPAELAKYGEVPLNEEWLPLTIADILSHPHTEPRTLVHAGVLRRPSGDDKSVVQSALGVVRIEPREHTGLRYFRSTHISAIDDAFVFNTRRVYHIPETQRQEFSTYEEDHDKTLMARHHTMIGLEPEFELLPENLRKSMLYWHELHPAYFGAQDVNKMENYPRDFFNFFDDAKKAYQSAVVAEFNSAQIEEMKKNDETRAKLFFSDELALGNEVMRRKMEAANTNAATYAMGLKIAQTRRGNGGSAILPSRGFTKDLDPMDTLWLQQMIPMPSARFTPLEHLVKTAQKSSSQIHKEGRDKIDEIIKNGQQSEEEKKRAAMKERRKLREQRKTTKRQAEEDDTPVIDEGVKGKPVKRMREATLDD